MQARFVAAIIILVPGTNRNMYLLFIRSFALFGCFCSFSMYYLLSAMSTCSSGSHGSPEASSEAKGEKLVEDFSLTGILQKATFRDLPAGRDWRRM